jgi:dTDP-4-amino-4,6-dideoxygalactose transaminase
MLGVLPWTLRGMTTVTDGSGPIEALERDFCELVGVKHALTLNSGTSALHSAYVAVGVGPGTEVIVPSYTWHASATPVFQCSAVPVFCEIDPRTLTLDPDDVERRITPRTRAICAVHIWGNPAEMDRLVEIARRHGVALIEDCSHAHGALYRGRPVGGFGDVGCFSLNSAKPVDGGECGIVVTSDAKFFDVMLLLAHSGRIQNGQRAASFDLGDVSLGVKYRPHLAAVVLAHASLKRLVRRNREGERAWRILLEETEGVRGLRAIETLPEAERAGFYEYVFAYEGEELGGPSTRAFVDAVRAEGAPLIVNREHYPELHRLALFTSLDRRALGGGCFDPTRPWEEQLWREPLPVTERLVDQLVSYTRQLHGLPEKTVRQCGAALRKVATALVPQAEPARSPAPRVAAERGAA